MCTLQFVPSDISNSLRTFSVVRNKPQQRQIEIVGTYNERSIVSDFTKREVSWGVACRLLPFGTDLLQLKMLVFFILLFRYLFDGLKGS